MSHPTQSDSREFARQVRIESLKMVHRARASHIGSALSIGDIVAVLFGSVLDIDPTNPKWAQRDRFILSKGHACVAIYAALAIKGFFPIRELLSYGEDHSIFMNHISHKVPGVEFSTGSLGHGLPFGVGKALAARKQHADWRTFVLLSDGEWGEGSNWEACMFASHHRLDNLVAIIDYNKLQSLTTIAETLALEPLAMKLSAFGWSVREVDGHNHDELTTALASAPWEAGKPSVLIAHTTKGKGVSFMENSVQWHYRNPNDAQLSQALTELES
jgi:transketolase